MAGILDIIFGFLWILGVVLLVLILLGFSEVLTPPTGITLVKLKLMIVALVLVGLVDIMGGIVSLRRKKWLLALIGSLCAVPVGLGIAATALILLSKGEFE